MTEGKPDDQMALPSGTATTRRRLVEAAAEVIADRGYQRATLSEIAARAGLTTGAVYSAFGSKQALLVAVCTEVGDPYATVMGRAARGLGEAVRELARDAAGYASDPAAQRAIRLQLEMFQLGMRDPGIFELLAAYARDQVASDATWLESLAVADGRALPLPAEEMAILLAACLNGLAQLRLVNPELAPEGLFLRLVDRLFGLDSDPAATATATATAGGPPTGRRAATRRTRREV